MLKEVNYSTCSAVREQRKQPFHVGQYKAKASAAVFVVAISAATAAIAVFVVAASAAAVFALAIDAAAPAAVAIDATAAATAAAPATVPDGDSDDDLSLRIQLL